MIIKNVKLCTPPPEASLETGMQYLMITLDNGWSDFIVVGPGLDTRDIALDLHALAMGLETAGLKKYERPKAKVELALTEQNLYLASVA